MPGMMGSFGSRAHKAMVNQMRVEDLPPVAPTQRYSGESDYMASGGSTPDDMAARLTRAQWSEFLDKYSPIEDQAIATAMGDAGTGQDLDTLGNAAGRIASSSFKHQLGQGTRQLSRAGVQLTAEERASVNRRQNLAGAANTAGAENITRRGTRERNVNALGQLAGIGRGVATTASGGLNSAANMQTGRELQGIQNKAAKSAQRTQMFASAAAIALAVMI